ncbi:Spo0B domain-containing protein [Paludifilum halophilum]|uniref:SpoOB alpha-helical domain-containing protein n=1 Tax=Paludifilum halophilum TaxID=1642702 RepID=A0A235B7G5_9BACL|nr:Spo0B domain-containing protein [Paludifilum halophilum]OYD08244.1 hypothetical protein CHM34_05165 [Paludifilum halophilum]
MEDGWTYGFKHFAPACGFILLMALQPWGWSVGVPLGFLTVCMLLRGWKRFGRALEKQCRLRNADETLQLLSRHRHDWMNHVQVVTGYASMGQAQRIPPYLEKQVNRLQEERLISRVEPSFLALTLVTLPQEYPEWQWEIHVDESARRLTFRDGERIQAALKEVLSRLTPFSGDGEDPAEIWLRLWKEGKEVRLTLDPELPVDHLPSTIDREELRDRIKRWKAVLQPEAESMTIRFPG